MFFCGKVNNSNFAVNIIEKSIRSKRLFCLFDELQYAMVILNGNINES